MVFVLIGISLPVIWIGLVLQYSSASGWVITPNSGYCDFIDPPDGERAVGRSTGSRT